MKDRGPEALNRDRTDKLLYELARHLLNPDNMPSHVFQLKGAGLLSEVHALNPERYDAFMKPK